MDKRVKSGLAITQDHLRLCDENLRYCGARSRNDFVEQAIEFYVGYLNANRKVDFLGDAVTEEISSSISHFTKVFSTNQYRMAVAVTALLHLLAREHNYSPVMVDTLMKQCASEVKSLGSLPDFVAVAQQER